MLVLSGICLMRVQMQEHGALFWRMFPYFPGKQQPAALFAFCIKQFFRDFAFSKQQLRVFLKPVRTFPPKAKTESPLIVFYLLKTHTPGCAPPPSTPIFVCHLSDIFRILLKNNYLTGSLSGPKSPIFRHTSQFFLTVALHGLQKIASSGKKWILFLSQTRPAK